MASLNSLPFVIEAKIENRVFLNSLCGSQFTTFSLKKPLGWGNVRSLSWGKKRVLWGGNKLVRAKSNESDDDKNDVNDDDDTEAALQATIEKSKKVFAMRKELLQQIAERRKLVSSIKNSIINPDDELSAKDSENTSPEIDIGTNHESVANVYPNNITTGKNVNPAPSTKQYSGGLPKALSRTSMDSTKQKEVTMPSKSNGYFRDGRREAMERPPLGQTPFTVDSVRKTENIRTLSDFLTKTSQPSSHKDEKDQKLEESTSKAASNPAIDFDSEDAKSPPLAGDNVMNVILVAAECAPWVKTGRYYSPYA